MVLKTQLPCLYLVRGHGTVHEILDDRCHPCWPNLLDWVGKFNIDGWSRNSFNDGSLTETRFGRWVEFIEDVVMEDLAFMDPCDLEVGESISYCLDPWETLLYVFVLCLIGVLHLVHDDLWVEENVYFLSMKSAGQVESCDKTLVLNFIFGCMEGNMESVREHIPEGICSWLLAHF